MYSATGGRAQAQRVGDEGRDVDVAHLQAVQISRRSLGAKIASLRGPRGPEELAEGYEAADDGRFSALGKSAAAPPLGVRHKLLNTLGTRYTCLTDSLPSIILVSSANQEPGNRRAFNIRVNWTRQLYSPHHVLHDAHAPPVGGGERAQLVEHRAVV